MIYTIDYLKKEAEGIIGSWNGSDEKWTHEGDFMTEEDVNLADDLLDKIKEVEELASELHL